MDMDELKEIIYDAQRGASGCGCCADSRDEEESFKEAVDKIWNEFERLRGPTER